MTGIVNLGESFVFTKAMSLKEFQEQQVNALPD